jgi:hypothetical protein
MTRKSRKKSTPARASNNALWNKYGHYFTFERVLVGSIILITLLAVIFLAVNSRQNRQVDIDGVEHITGLAQGHNENVTYPDDGAPPAGGNHSATLQNCGIYDSPINSANAVHSLEHGAVWITYRPDLPQDQVDKLRDITRGGSHRLLSPYPNQTSPVVLTAWGLRLRVDNADDSQITAFVNNYESGPQTPELGAPCRGGTGQPLG